MVARKKKKNAMKGKSQSRIRHVDRESYITGWVVAGIDQGIPKTYFARPGANRTSWGHEFSKAKGSQYITGSQVQGGLKNTLGRIHQV